jgi:hypothetical protein
MRKTTTIFTLSWVFIFFCLSSSSSAFPGTGEIDLEFRGQIMSAELQGVPLRLILEKLRREKGIWFKGDESVLEETVSIRFENLPLEEGLRRILSGISHVLLFDQEKRPVGLVVFGKKESRGAVLKDEPPAMEKGRSSEPVKEAMDSGDPFKTSPHPFQLATPKTKSTGTTGGENLPLSREHQDEITEEASMEPSPSPEDPFTQRNPFTEKTSPSPENPFSGNVSPSPEDPFTQRNPFTEKTSPSPENPFNEDVSPSPEDPFTQRNPFTEKTSPSPENPF